MSYVGFDNLVKKLAAKGVRNPKGAAAAIGRRKYGKAKFQHAAATGRKLGHK